ncbi:MAG: aldehyde ferredoxin oxidoreductase family protein [Euryarchaeota archaeon]|nr:aldehyde ferredoxin oxidoreductase family protein [Euryarchaeota archaeon]
MSYPRDLAIVDLTKKTVHVEEIPDSLRRMFLGGRGLNVYYLNKYLLRGVEPFSPENLVIFGAGLLTGTMAPSSSRMNVTGKSPETFILGDGNIGGFFGAEMRSAGFDHLIVKGKAERPTYLYIKDGKVEFRDGTPYWGHETLEVQEMIRKDFGDTRVEMVVIGVGGEKLVRFAAVRSGYKRSARTGMGAVMGSKNLKAIVATGTEALPVADPATLLVRGTEIHHYVGSSKVAKVLGTVGTAFLYDTSNAIGAIRTKNSQLNSWVDELDSEHIEGQVEKMVSCSSCFVHCTHRNTLGGEGPEYSTTGIMGANIGVLKTEQLIELNNISNDVGFDTSSLGTILAWHMELYQRGIITKEQTGEPLLWADEDYEGVKRWIGKITRREGWGNVMAESTRALPMGLVPPMAADYLIAVKGLPQSDPHDVRYLKAFGLGLAVASRGADHLRNRPTLEIFMNLPIETKEKIYGKGVTRDPTIYEGKAQTVAFSDDMFAVVDSAGICKFVTHGFNSPHLVDFEIVRELTEHTTGIKLTREETIQVGRNVIDMERLFNVREGVTRKDDTLPKRYFDEPMPSRLAKGHRIERAGFEKMLNEYYEIRGWTRDGMLSPERQRQLESVIANPPRLMPA